MELWLVVMGFGQKMAQRLRLEVEFLSRQLGKADAILNLAVARRALAGSSAVFRPGEGWQECMVSSRLGSFHPKPEAP